MKIRESGKTLIGGFVVYVAMAACSAGGPGAPSGNGGATGLGGAGGSASVAGGYDAGDILDALTDPVPDASADPVSGSRLKAKYRIADDGSKEYLAGSWYDSQRQEDCSFQLSADGATRCLPTSTPFPPYYADAACSQPLFQSKQDNPACSSQAPKYGHATFGVCDSLIRLYSVGAKVDPVNLYYFIGGSNCVQGDLNAGYEYYLRGAEIPPTSFVGAKVMHD